MAVDELYMQRPSELSRRLDVSQLLGHFVVGRSLPLEPPGWHRRQMDGWTLLCEPSLPAQELLDSSGAEIGWLVGHPIDLQAETMVTSQLQAPVEKDAGVLGSEFEDWLYSFGGRFAAIMLYPKPMLYPDGGATLPVLFDAELQCAASSPFLLCSPDGTVPDSPLVEVIGAIRAEGSFTLGATPHAEADALMANHVLDLVRWEQSRVWPAAPFDSDQVALLVERVVTTLERTVVAVAAIGHLNFGLTAGGDCRAVLACARNVLDRVRSFTVAFPDDLGATDLATAPALARRFGIGHRVIPWLEPSATDAELFMYRTGCLSGERRGRRATRTYRQLGGSEVYVSSVGSEISREIGRRRFDSLSDSLTPEELLWRFTFPPHPELLRRTSDWLAALPKGLSRVDTLTLFYAEMCECAWGGPLTTAYPDAYTFALYPFMHRVVLDAVLRLPQEYRLSGRLREDIIASRWQELLDIPINRRPVGVIIRQEARRSLGLAEAGLSWGSWNRLIRRVWRERSAKR